VSSTLSPDELCTLVEYEGEMEALWPAMAVTLECFSEIRRDSLFRDLFPTFEEWLLDHLHGNERHAEIALLLLNLYDGSAE